MIGNRLDDVDLGIPDEEKPDRGERVEFPGHDLNGERKGDGSDWEKGGYDMLTGGLLGLTGTALGDIGARTLKWLGDTGPGAWLRSAGAYWAARSSIALGDAAAATGFLRMAADTPTPFYGMIAERQVRLAVADAEEVAPTGHLVLAAYRADDQDTARFVANEPRAHRAAALVQIGRIEDARQELRAGLAGCRPNETFLNFCCPETSGAHPGAP